MSSLPNQVFKRGALDSSFPYLGILDCVIQSLSVTITDIPKVKVVLGVHLVGNMVLIVAQWKGVSPGDMKNSLSRTPRIDC